MYMYSYGEKCLLAITLGWRYNSSLYGNWLIDSINYSISTYLMFTSFLLVIIIYILSCQFTGIALDHTHHNVQECVVGSNQQLSLVATVPTNVPSNNI